MRRLRSFLRTRRSERGYTLIEMMIVMSLLSLVTAAAFGVVNVMSNQAAKTTDRFSAEAEGQTIADRITKDLRTAVVPTTLTAAFASANSNDLVFYASLTDLSAPGAGPIKMHAYVSQIGTTGVYAFHEDATPPDALSAPNYTYTTAAINRIDGKYLDTSQPIFTYYTASDPVNAIPVPITTLTGLRSIDSVGITLRVRVHPNSPVVVISTRIHVRNVDYNPNT